MWQKGILYFLPYFISFSKVDVKEQEQYYGSFCCVVKMRRSVVISIFFSSLVFSADVNLIWINEANFDVASQSVKAALEAIARNSSIGINIVTKETLELAKGDDGMAAIEKVCSKLDSLIDAKTPPDVILDSTRSGDASDAIKSLTRSLGIPTVSFSFGGPGDISDWNSLSPDQEKYLIQIRPPADVITGTIRNLVSAQNISSAAILYDDSFVMDYHFMTLLVNLPTRHIIQMIGDIGQQLKHFSNVGLNNIFILGSSNAISAVMKIANDMDLFGPKYAWFALTKDNRKDFVCFCSDVTVLFMHPLPLDNKGNLQTLRNSYAVKAGPDIDVAFYYDATIMTLKAISAMKTVKSWPNDLVYTKCKDFSGNDAIIRKNLDLRQTMKTVDIPPMFGRLLVSTNGASTMRFKVDIDKLKFTKNNLLRTDPVATWLTDSSTSLTLKSNNSLSGFSATTYYNVVTVVKPPFVYKTIDSKGKAVYTGYCIDLLKDLAALMHFDFNLYEPPDGQYGSLNESLQWNGLIKEIIDGRADFGVGAIAVMAERESVVDFTVPFYDMVGIIILMKLPYVPTSLFKFLSVLDDTVWGCIVAAYFITSFLMWIFDRFSPYSYQNNMDKYKDDEEKRYFDLKECLWFCMTSLTPQGGGEAPKNVSGRLLAATWWLFGFIIIASYTANLAAFLTVSRLETAVTSLDDLSKQYKIKYSPMNNSDAMIYFQRRAYIEDKFYQIWKNMSLDDSMNDYERAQLAIWDYPIDDTYTKMWQTMLEAGMPESIEKAIDRIRNPPDQADYAFLGDASDLRYQVLLNCDLQVVGDEFSRKPYAIPVPQGSPLKDQITDGILQLQNARQLETYKERWWNENPLAQKCDHDNSDDGGGGISIYNIGGVFIVILVGIGLAFITLIFEYWYYKNKKPEDEIIQGKSSRQIEVKQAIGTFGRDNKTFVDSESPTAYRRPLPQRMGMQQANKW